MTNEHGQSFQTEREGMYMLPVELRTQQRIRAEAKGYEQAEPMALVDVPSRHQLRIDVEMRKIEIGYGDVPLSVACPREDLRPFSMTPTHIRCAAFKGNQTQLFRMNHDGGELEAMGPLPTTSGLARINGAPYFVTTWRARLYRITDRGTVRIIRRFGTDWPSGLAFDGSRLWYIEASAIDNRFRVHAVELESGDPIGHFASSDIHIRGLAWGRGRLWIASLAGVVYELDPNKALWAGRLEAGIVRRFPGSYSRLSLSGWAPVGIGRRSEAVL